MKTGVIVILVVVYFIGLLTVEYLDNIFRLENQSPGIHYVTLFLMWIFTPVLLIVFLIKWLITKLKGL